MDSGYLLTHLSSGPHPRRWGVTRTVRYPQYLAPTHRGFRTSSASLIHCQPRVPGPSSQTCRCPTTLSYLPHWKLNTTSVEIYAQVAGHKPPSFCTLLHGSGTLFAAYVSQANPKLLPCFHSLGLTNFSAGPYSSYDEMTILFSQHKLQRDSMLCGLRLELE